METTALDEQPISHTFHSQHPKSLRLLPPLTLLAMLCAFLLTGAVLPLRGLYFFPALINQLTPWILAPTYLLFPGQSLDSTFFSPQTIDPTALISWQETGLLLALFILLLFLYLFAIRSLPGLITKRYLLFSTLLLGGLCLLFPILTSPDIFSYIAYARLGIVYHLNPLAATPLQIAHDPIYPLLYWKDQPSAYGPTWALITCSLQWLITAMGISNTAAIPWMVLALRLLGLLAHLGSTLLVWSIGGHLQRSQGKLKVRTRMQATLAFAWNPLLLFEACTNAHNDTILLFFILATIWLLVRNTAPTFRTYSVITLMLVVATCLKVNVALFFPGLLLLIWTQTRRLSIIGILLVIYAAGIAVLYLPFWQGGAILNLLHVNPGTYRNINSLAEFVSFGYNSSAHLLGAPTAAQIGSPAENLVHTMSMALFALNFVLLTWQAYRRNGLRTPLHLLRWMALTWLLYCLIGAPWYWPWYIVTFFGLFALIETVDSEDWQKHSFSASFPLAARVLAFSMLSLYCFFCWAPSHSMLPLLTDFHLAYLSGLWIWLLPFSVCVTYSPRVRKWLPLN